MCIDKPEHYARGKAPLPLASWKGLQVLWTGKGWAALAEDMRKDSDMWAIWEEDIGKGEAEDAAFAECFIRDWANNYDFAWVEGQLVLFGES